MYLDARMHAAMGHTPFGSILVLLVLLSRPVPISGTTPVRLIGQHAYEGRIEVYHNGVWGTICDDDFDQQDAVVICRMMGFSSEGTVFPNAYFGAGSGRIWLHQVHCTGNEPDIADCRHSAWGTHTCTAVEDVGVRCVPMTGRLIGGRGNFEGRIDINSDGHWGTICATEFDDKDAEVMCRALGFNGGKAVTGGYFGQGVGHIWAEGLQCYGNEYNFAACDRRNAVWGSVAVSHCNHSNDAGVRCEHTAVRLVGGALPSEGRVEVQHNGVWGGICSSGFTSQDADVLCRMLGFNSSAISIHLNAHFGEGEGPVWLSNMGCHGNETDLRFCSMAGGWDNNSCSHSNDVGISCQPTDVRLVGDIVPWEGLLEILLNGTWGRVCGINFADTEANVICRMLGYSGRDAVHDISYGRNSGFPNTILLLDELRCQGDENDVSQCSATFHHNCNVSDAVWLRCQGARVRLVGGSHSGEGRVELLHNAQWGSICDAGWNDHDATAICQSVMPIDTQYGYMIGHAVSGHYFGYGEGPVWLSDVRCNGSESDVMSCPHDVNGGINCDHSRDAGVWCENPPLWGNISLNGRRPGHGILEHNDRGIRSFFCFSNWTPEDVQVVCRELGFWTAVPAIYEGNSGFIAYMTSIQCKGNEGAMYMCPNAGRWQLDRCQPQPTGVLGITCTPQNIGPTEIRLVDGPGPWRGRLEIKLNGYWHSHCHQSWDSRFDDIVCKTLHFLNGNATSFPTPRGYTSTLLRPLDCVGNETNIGHCPTQVHVHSCDGPRDFVVGIDCSGGVIVDISSPDTLAGTVDFQLSNTSLPVPVCATNVSTATAKVICAVAGYRDMSPNITNISPSNETLQANIRCDGWEAHVSQCTTDLSIQNCSAAAIHCFACQKTFTSKYGAAWSPNFPSSYPANTDCLFIVTPAGNQPLKLQFRSLDLPGDGDYVEVRDGPHGKQLGYFSSTSAVPYLVTDGNFFIRLKSNANTGAMGFNVSWSPLRIEDTVTMGCGAHGWNIAVNMTLLRHLYPDSGVSQVKLADQQCTGKVMGDMLLFQQSYTDCSTQSKTSGESVVYTSQLVYPDTPTPFPVIVRGYRWKVEVECDVARDDVAQTSFHPNSSLVHQTPHVAGSTHYSISTKFYTDGTYYKEIKGNALSLKTGDDVFVRVSVDTDDGHVKMRLATCYTQPAPGARPDQTYTLIDDGCVVDQSTTILSQGTHETRFMFTVFEFPTSRDNVYVFCNATFCKTSDLTNRCSQICHGTPTLVGRSVAYAQGKMIVGVVNDGDDEEMRRRDGL